MFLSPLRAKKSTISVLRFLPSCFSSEVACVGFDPGLRTLPAHIAPDEPETLVPNFLTRRIHNDAGASTVAASKELLMVRSDKVKKTADRFQTAVSGRQVPEAPRLNVCISRGICPPPGREHRYGVGATVDFIHNVCVAHVRAERVGAGPDELSTVYTRVINTPLPGRIQRLTRVCYLSVRGNGRKKRLKDRKEAGPSMLSTCCPQRNHTTPGERSPPYTAAN